MFQLYTEKARRIIFFARYEASQFGSGQIDTEHLLLGILREDKWLTGQFLRSHKTVESIRKEIEAHTTVREKIATSVDLPLSNESKRVLAYAAEEAQGLGDKHIGPEHLLLGLLRDEKCFAAQLLKKRGVKLNAAREEIAKGRPEEPAPATAAAEPGVLKDLTQAAMDGLLGPVVERDLELDCVVEILCTRRRRNVLLIGPHGAGKSAIVEGVAQRIAGSAVPDELIGARILTANSALLDGWGAGPGSRRFRGLAELLTGNSRLDQIVLFIQDFQAIMDSRAQPATDDFVPFLASALGGGMRCIAAARAGDLKTAAQTRPWLERWFREVRVRPLNAAGTLAALRARKAGLEKFLEVTYADEALETAVKLCYGSARQNPTTGGAVELLDAAGAMVKLRRPLAPQEIRELQASIRQTDGVLETAVANHEFEKARFYSDELRKEREKLHALEEELKEILPPEASVTAEDVRQEASRWSEYPYA